MSLPWSCKVEIGWGGGGGLVSSLSSNTVINNKKETKKIEAHILCLVFEKQQICPHIIFTVCFQ